MKKHLRFLRFICVLLSALLLTGCGRTLVITTGFGRGEVFRIGSSRCRIAEVRVYMLDLQKENEALYGRAIWEGGQSGALQEAVREQALSQLVRVKALNLIGVSRNVMLTSQEERQAEDAEHRYYAGLSEAETKYIGLDEKELQRMFREFALAGKTWRSLGEEAEKVYGDFLEETPCDLNTVYWQDISLKELEGDLEAPGFLQCCTDMSAGDALSGPAGSQEAADQDQADAADTAAKEQEAAPGAEEAPETEDGAGET